jgi:hypothetical protein
MWRPRQTGGQVSEVRLRSKARRRRPFCRPWVSGHTDACTHIGARSHVTDLQPSSMERRFCSIGGVAGGARRSSASLEKLQVPGADAAPESATTLASGAGGRHDRFSTIEKRRRGCAGCRAQSARMSESDSATAQAVCRSGRVNPRCGDPDRGTAVIRLGTARASAARVAEPVLGLSHFSAPIVQVAWRKCTVGQRVAGGRRGGAAMQTSAFAVFDGRLEK